MTDEKKETLSKDLAPAVQKMVSGHWQEAIPMLTAVVSTTLSSQLVGPILGPLLGSTAGGVASLLAGLLSSSAEKRMMSEDVRLQSESAEGKARRRIRCWLAFPNAAGCIFGTTVAGQLARRGVGVERSA